MAYKAKKIPPTAKPLYTIDEGIMAPLSMISIFGVLIAIFLLAIYVTLVSGKPTDAFIAQFEKPQDSHSGTILFYCTLIAICGFFIWEGINKIRAPVVLSIFKHGLGLENRLLIPWKALSDIEIRGKHAHFLIIRFVKPQNMGAMPFSVKLSTVLFGQGQGAFTPLRNPFETLYSGHAALSYKELREGLETFAPHLKAEEEEERENTAEKSLPQAEDDSEKEQATKTS